MCLWEVICSHFLGILQLPLLLAGYVDIIGFGCSWKKQSVFEGRVSLEWNNVGESSSWDLGYSMWWSLHHSHVDEIGRLSSFIGIAF